MKRTTYGDRMRQKLKEISKEIVVRLKELHVQ